MIPSLLFILGRRLAAVLPVFAIVTMLVFGALRVLPVDPAQMSMPPSATTEQVEAKRQQMGLNKPIYAQYGYWLRDVAHGDFGRSTQYGVPTSQLILERLPATIELALSALIFAIVIGVAGGIAIFSLRGTPFETAGLLVTSALMALPDFLLALLLILIFGVLIPIFPVNGRIDPSLTLESQTGFMVVDALLSGDLAILRDVLSHMALPVMALGFAFSPTIIRVLHASLGTTYQQSYIKQARLRGISDRNILFGQALKNAILPVVILVGTQFGGLFGGTLLVETIFSYPGLGNLMLKGMQAVDLPVIMTVSLVYCATTLLFNSLADAGAYLLNPRLRA